MNKIKSHTADPYRQSRRLVSCRCGVTSWRRSLKHLHLSWSHNRFVRLTSGVFGGHSFVSTATLRRSPTVAAWPLLGGERCHLERWGSANLDFANHRSSPEMFTQQRLILSLSKVIMNSTARCFLQIRSPVSIWNQQVVPIRFWLAVPYYFPIALVHAAKKEENWHIYLGIISTSVVSSISKKT